MDSIKKSDGVLLDPCLVTIPATTPLVAEEADCDALDVGGVAAAVTEVQRLLQHQPGVLAPGLDHDDPTSLLTIFLRLYQRLKKSRWCSVGRNILLKKRPFYDQN